METSPETWNERNERPINEEEKRILANIAIRETYIVPIDPMDDLQCDSCQ